MSKRSRSILGVKSIMVCAACLLVVFFAGCTGDQQTSYSQNYSSLEKALDFKLNNSTTYYDKLNAGEESILLFWGSWCPHCESLIDSINELDNARIIKEHLFTVAEDESLRDIAVHEGEFPIYLDQNKNIYEEFALEHIPTVFIVNDQGDVLASAQGEKDSLDLLVEYAEHNCDK